jgi:hypothetical protein
VARVAELGLLARPFSRQPSLAIGGGLMSVIAALLAVEIDARITRIVIGRRADVL